MIGSTTYQGMRVVESALATAPNYVDLPRFALRPWVPVSPAFRQEFDAWLAATFGLVEMDRVERGRKPSAYVLDLAAAGFGEGKVLYAHPEWVLRLRMREFARA